MVGVPSTPHVRPPVDPVEPLPGWPPAGPSELERRAAEVRLALAVVGSTACGDHDAPRGRPCAPPPPGRPVDRRAVCRARVDSFRVATKARR